MRNNESEFELVLGNRQLLSGFFVVALLFGVAFAMGYIVGRNSIPSPKVQADAPTPATAASQNRPQPAPPEPKPPEQQPPAPGDETAAAPGTQAATEPEPATQPAKDGPVAPAPSTYDDPGPSVPSAASALAEPQPGTYWQVTAIPQPEAEIFAKVLRNKGFRVSLTQGTKNLTRVLVGPYPDRESLGRAKSDLEGSGFHPVILKKE